MTTEKLQTLGASVRTETFVRHYQWVHDWQRYVPYDMQKIWGSLTDEARGAAVLVGQGAADAEEWD